MDAVGEDRAEQRGDAILKPGDNQSIRSRAAELVADDCRIERLYSGAGAEGGISRAEEVVVDVENTARDARRGAILEQNGIRDGDVSDLQPRNPDLQLTLKLGDAVEDDARAIAGSLTALLASLKSALSEVTGSSVEHMRSETEAVGQVQDAAIDAATKGNRFINACLRLNEEMKGMNHVVAQLEILKHRVDQFEHQSSRYLPRH